VNGAGKSTFVRMLAGVEPYDSGSIVTGYNVAASYFAQHQAEELDLSSDVLGVVDSVATGEIRTRLRTILGAFLFHGDDVFKRFPYFPEAKRAASLSPRCSCNPPTSSSWTNRQIT